MFLRRLLFSFEKDCFKANYYIVTLLGKWEIPLNG